jgi:hypothetical protein
MRALTDEGDISRKSRSTFCPTIPPLWKLLREYDTKEKLGAAREYFGVVQPDVSGFLLLGRLTSGRFGKGAVATPCRFVYKRLSSNAMGSNELGVLLDMHGRGIFDFYLWMKTSNFKLMDYKLDTVARTFVDDNKLPLDIQTMFAYWRSGEPKKMEVLTSSCSPSPTASPCASVSCSCSPGYTTATYRVPSSSSRSRSTSPTVWAHRSCGICQPPSRIPVAVLLRFF